MQNRLFAEIIADHVRHEIVDGLVVGRAVARSVDDRHIARPVGGQDSRHADHGIRVERERVEIFVGQTAVDHADAVFPAGIVEEVHFVVHDFEVFGERERRAGFLGQVCMFEERGIVPAGGEHHCYAVGGDEIHGLAQQSWIIAIVAHTYVAEQAGRDSAFDIAGEQQIAGTGWNAQIVFQHPPLPVLPLHQVLAGDVREHAARRCHAVDLRKVSRGRVHVFFRHDAVLDGLLVGVDVAQVGVQRVDALFQSGFHSVEFVRFDDARNRIVRKQPVMVLAVLVDAEPYAITAQLSVDRLPTIDQFRSQPSCGGFNHRSTLPSTPCERMPI